MSQDVGEGVFAIKYCITQNVILCHAPAKSCPWLLTKKKKKKSQKLTSLA